MNFVGTEAFLNNQETEAGPLTVFGAEQQKKLISFEACSTISSMRNQDSFWLYTGPSIGQDMANTVDLYYMQTMGSQTTSHLLGLDTQAHCILTFTFFPSPSLVFTKYKLYCRGGSYGAPQAASHRDSQGCWDQCSSFTGCVGTV